MRRRGTFKRLASERGQVLPIVALAAVVLIGFAGLAVDLGRVWVAKQELQKAVDAAALAAGRQLPNSQTAYNAALSYAGTPTGHNALGGWGVSAPATGVNVTFECLSHGPDYVSGATPTCMTDTSSNHCQPSGASAPLPGGVTTCNAVQVTETATVKTGLLSLFLPSFKLKASSQSAASVPNTIPAPMNTVVILDTTGSMTSSCSAAVTGISSPDKLDCAKAGVRSLLQGLDPCLPGVVSCGGDLSGTTNVQNPIDEAGIVVFPALSGNLTQGGVSTGSTVSSTTTTGNQVTTTPTVTTGNFVTTTPTVTTGTNVTTTPLYKTTTTIKNNKTTVNTTTTVTGYTTSTTTTTGTVYNTTTTKTTGTVYNTTTTKTTGTVYNTTSTTNTTYNESGPSSAVLADETDCNSTSTDHLTSGSSDTYPPWQSYTYNSSASYGGIPLGITTGYSMINSFTGLTTSANPFFDNFSGYQAIPLSSDYRDSDTTTTLNTTANIVKSVDWAQCKNGSYPGGDYYGIKDISGQKSYLAGAISEAQYMLASTPTRTTANGAPMTNAIVILSDGEINSPNSSTDGVAPGQKGNIPFTDTTPCESAISAATAAKAAGTLIYSIAYDSSGQCDSKYTAAGLMQDMSSGTGYYYSQSNADSLASTFGQIGQSIVGTAGSALIPDCTPGPGC